MSKLFVVNKSDIEIIDDNIVIKGNILNHIKVLRYNINDNIQINDYIINILKITKDSIIGKVIKKENKIGEPNNNISLYQGYLKSDKMEYVVQKSVELGVKNIVPIITKNTVVKLDDKDKIKKIERLKKISTEALEQCGRTDNVEIENILEFKNILSNLKQSDIVFFAYENSNNILKDSIYKAKQCFEKLNKKICNISVIIGPEGGFDNKEIEFLYNNLDNLYEISLGNRILRSETASIYILSILGYEFE